MSKTTSKVLWILAGIFLIITGIGCLRNPGEILYGLPIIFGVAMMFSGIIDIVIFAAGHDYMAGSGWFLADGILTVLMSLFILGKWMVYSNDNLLYFRNVADFFRYHQTG